MYQGMKKVYLEAQMVYIKVFPNALRVNEENHKRRHNDQVPGLRSELELL